jgi:hypothetical protein
VAAYVKLLSSKNKQSKGKVTIFLRTTISLIGLLFK